MKEAFDDATAEGKSFNDALRAAACATIWKRAARADGAPNAVPAAMSAIATECALHAEERHSYLPNTPAQAATWRPHDWVLQAMSRAISFDRMLNPAAPAAPAVDALDAARLDWLEEQAKQSPTGISFDYVRHAEDGQVLEKGWRFMRRHFLGECKSNLRAAIDAAQAAAKGAGDA